jgi:hypothetical protein
VLRKCCVTDRQPVPGNISASRWQGECVELAIQQQSQGPNTIQSDNYPMRTFAAAVSYGAARAWHGGLHGKGPVTSSSLSGACKAPSEYYHSAGQPFGSHHCIVSKGCFTLPSASGPPCVAQGV